MLRHLWAMSKKSDSLWVKWVHMYIINHHNLWYMDTPGDASWTIRNDVWASLLFDILWGRAGMFLFGWPIGILLGHCLRDLVILWCL